MSRIRNVSWEKKLYKILKRINSIILREFPPAKINPKYLSYTSILLVVAGLGMFLFPSVYSQGDSPKEDIKSVKLQSVTDDTIKNNEPIKIDNALVRNVVYKEPPLRIVIPDLSIDLPIVMAKIVNGYWELSETTASHGMGSANPGELGNTVIFAHAREKLFLPLRKIKKDQNIYVLTPNNWYRYKVEDIKEVTPDKIEVIAPSSDERLTLFTCSGFLDKKRLIVVALPFRP